MASTGSSTINIVNNDSLSEPSIYTDPRDGAASNKEENGAKRKRRLLTVEPVLMFYMAAFVVMFPLSSQYVISVMNERYNVTFDGNMSSACGEIDTGSEEYKRQQKAQRAAAQLNVAYDLTQGLPSLFVSLFLGKFGIKSLIIINASSVSAYTTGPPPQIYTMSHTYI